MSGPGRIVVPLALLAAVTMILLAYLVARLRRRHRPGDTFVDYGTTTQPTDPYFPLDSGQHHHGATTDHGHGDGGHHSSTHDSGGGGSDAGGGGDSGGGDSGGGGD